MGLWKENVWNDIWTIIPAFTKMNYIGRLKNTHLSGNDRDSDTYKIDTRVNITVTEK